MFFCEPHIPVGVDFNGRNDYYYSLTLVFAKKNYILLIEFFSTKCCLGSSPLLVSTSKKSTTRRGPLDIPSSQLPDDITKSQFIYCGKSHDGSVICTLTLSRVVITKEDQKDLHLSLKIFALGSLLINMM